MFVLVSTPAQNQTHVNMCMHAEDHITIGRRSSCVVRIQHPSVSGLHCIVTRRVEDSQLGSTVEPQLWLEDNSTNGTTVNGNKLGKGNSVLIRPGIPIIILPAGRDRNEHSFRIHLLKSSTTGTNPFAKEYDVREKLGSGAFADVMRCIHRRSGVQYAVKIIDKKKFARNHLSERPEAIQDEIKILQHLDHPNIIKIKDLFETSDKMFLVLELVSGGDLFDEIVSLDGLGFPEERVRVIFRQMVKATEYLHSRNIVHRDIKPENVLLARKGENAIKLTDFGLSRVIPEGSYMRTLCGTPQYLAPEVLKNIDQSCPYGKCVDLWSLGVVLFIMLSGQQPFDERDPGMPLMEQIKLGKILWDKRSWRSISSSAQDLVRGLLKLDPRDRLTIKNIYIHTWMRGGDQISASRSGKRKADAISMSPNGNTKRHDPYRKHPA